MSETLNVPARPQFPGIVRALSLLLRATGNRSRLATLELLEVRENMIQYALLAAVALGVCLLAGISITLLFASLIWDSPNRAWWLAALTCLYLAVASLAVTNLIFRLRVWRPLAETQNQLREDYQCLRTLLAQMNP